MKFQKGQVIRFSQDVEYATAGEAYEVICVEKTHIHIERVSSKALLGFRSGTSIGRGFLAVMLSRGLTVEIVGA